MQWYLAGAVLGTFLFGVVTVAGQFWLAPLAILLLIAAIGLAIYRGQLKAQDIEHRRLEILQGFFATVGDDFARKAKCSLSADFQGYQKHGRLLNRQGNNSNHTEFFTDRWFDCKGELMDGNTFSVRVAQRVRRHTRSGWVTRYGKSKYKTKVKERLDERVTLVVKISPETYPRWEELRNVLPLAAVGNLALTQLHVGNGFVRLSAATAPVKGLGGTVDTSALVDQHSLAALFVYLYAGLQQCRAATARPAGWGTK